MIADALRSREGQLYLAGAALAFLLAGLLLVSTVRQVEHEAAMAEAVEAFAQGRSEAGPLLRELRGRLPDDVTVRVLLGVYELRRARDLAGLDTARLLFEEALERDRARTSAVVGLLATRLRMAALLAPEARAAAAADVVSLARELGRDTYEPRHPDLLTAEGAALVLAGRAAEALPLLEDPAPGGLLPSREGAGARHQALAAARLLLRRAGAIEPAALAQASRWAEDAPEDAAPADVPDGDPGRLLALAYRVELADPRLEPSDLEALAARCARAEALLPSSPARRGPPQLNAPPPALLAGVYNALGIGWYRAGRHAEAVAAFERASDQVRGREPIYLLNLAQARYRAGLAAPTEGPERARLLGASVDAYTRLAELLEGQEGREGTLVLAMTNAAAIALAKGDARQARNVYARFAKRHPSEVIGVRDLAVLEDHCRSRRAPELYRRALELQHPDAERIQARLRTYER